MFLITIPSWHNYILYSSSLPQSEGSRHKTISILSYDRRKKKLIRKTTEHTLSAEVSELLTSLATKLLKLWKLGK